MVVTEVQVQIKTKSHYKGWVYAQSVVTLCCKIALLQI